MLRRKEGEGVGVVIRGRMVAILCEKVCGECVGKGRFSDGLGAMKEEGVRKAL